MCDAYTVTKKGLTLLRVMQYNKAPRANMLFVCERRIPFIYTCICF